MSASYEDVLEELAAGKCASVYLFWGEEYLVRAASDEVVKTLVPDAALGLNLSILDSASAREIASDLATLPLFPGRKVVLVRDPEFLAPKKGRADVLSKARDAWKTGKRKEGARRVLAIAARAGWGVAELAAPDASAWKDELGVDLSAVDLAFLQEVSAYCKEERIFAPEGDVTPLVELLQKGLHPDQVLVIATTELDAKNPFIKVVQKKGRLVERKVAAKLKELDVSTVVRRTLGPHKKKLGPGAEALLKERCGGNMRLLQSELEKLAMYSEAPQITAAEVELLVHHAREDEFLELSDALQKRDFTAALRYVEHVLEQGIHPLPVLGTIASVVRTLIENRGRLQQLSRGTAPRSYDEFKRSVFPKIEEDAKAVGARVPHPYGAFLGMQAAGRYTGRELLKGLTACADADLTIKSSGDGKLAVERILWTLCGPKAA